MSVEVVGGSRRSSQGPTIGFEEGGKEGKDGTRGGNPVEMLRDMQKVDLTTTQYPANSNQEHRSLLAV